jgi:uncharacterized protein YunC (DUF1805 family)
MALVIPHASLLSMRHFKACAMGEVTPRAYKETAIIVGTTAKEREVLDALLDPTVRTYADAAARLGISEGAVKQRMSRLWDRVRRAKSFTNQMENWKRKRRELRRGLRTIPRAQAPPALQVPPVLQAPQAPDSESPP